MNHKNKKNKKRRRCIKEYSDNWTSITNRRTACQFRTIRGFVYYI